MLRLAFRQWARATAAAASSQLPPAEKVMRGQRVQQSSPAGHGRRAATSPGGTDRLQQQLPRPLKQGSSISSLFSNVGAAGSPARPAGGYSSSPGSGSHTAASPSLRSALRPLRLHPVTAAGAGSVAAGGNGGNAQQPVDASSRTTQRALAQQLLRQLASLGATAEGGQGQHAVSATEGRPDAPLTMNVLMMESSSAPFSSPQHAGVAAMAYALPPATAGGSPASSAPAGSYSLMVGGATAVAAFNILPQSPKVAIAVVAAAVHPASMSRLRLAGLSPPGGAHFGSSPYY